VLTNFAGLLYKTGAIDEALAVMKDAIDVDNKDPDSNFFIANLYSAKVRSESICPGQSVIITY
jgi:hypothetical protein